MIAKWTFLLLYTTMNMVCAFKGFRTGCERTPHDIDVQKTPGDGGFSILFSGNPSTYVPGEVYIARIKGNRTHFRTQKFTSFLMVVESSKNVNIYGPQSVGTFQLYGDIQTMHSDRCPNAIKEASNIQKRDIQVKWTAPPRGSGCLTFKATVVDTHGQWYMDDGELTKQLCEEVQENPERYEQAQNDCCTCDEAKYEVTFEGLWSRQTHPKDFPANEWLTHFSDIIGASHTPNYKLWSPGELASDGLRQVAEWGSTRTLESELKQQSNQIRTIIKARGLWYPNVNGKTFAVFRVDNRHHHISLVSMLGPSPDWIVGISSLDLCLRNCSWAPGRSINLYPWDAGTDSGITYMSANSPSIPRERIKRITNANPSDSRSPFYDPNGLPMKPLARLTITRQRVYEKSCTEEIASPYYLTEDEESDIGEPSEMPECATTEWSEWTPCSMTCGKGLRSRTRSYLIPLKADMLQCNRIVIEREMCAGLVPFCPEGSMNDIFGHNQVRTEPLCTTTPWSKWSTCSATCGEGVNIRTRKYVNRMGRKRCSENLTERRPCIGETQVCNSYGLEEINPECAVTQWSNWSPCSVTCGKGIRGRSRYFLVPSAEERCGIKLVEKMLCEGEKPDCTINENEAKEVCLSRKVIGPCRGYFRRYYYDSERRACLQFVYGGCKGNRNNFKNYEECTRMCESSRDTMYEGHNKNVNGHPNVPEDEFFDSSLSSLPLRASGSGTFNRTISFLRNNQGKSFSDQSNDRYQHSSRNLMNSNHGRGRNECEVSPWSEWSEWSNGWRESTRFVKNNTMHSGYPCPKKLRRRRKCRHNDCSGLGGRMQKRIFNFNPLH